MDEYFIGAGALLTAGPRASIRAASLHAQPETGDRHPIAAAVVDLESARAEDISQLLLVAAGWSGSRFHAEVVQRLLAQGECALADVISTLARAVETSEIHLFARWQPDAPTIERLREQGVQLCCHPVEAIGQAALVSGQRVERWRPPVRAA